MFRRRPENDPSSNLGIRSTTKSIEIDGLNNIYSVAFLADGKHIVSGGDERKIRRWKVDDGKKVGGSMDAGSDIRSIAVSRDGKSIVSGTKSGLVTVWNAESQEPVVELRGHSGSVCAVDISPDGTRVATGSDDKTARVWSLSTGAQRLGPWQHGFEVTAVKFSPNGLLIATGTWRRKFIRIYNSHNGNLLVDASIRVNSWWNETLAWSGDSKQLLVLSGDGDICCLEVSTGALLLRWNIHGSLALRVASSRNMSLASNGKFIAVSSASSVSFWDTMTHELIGSTIKHTADIQSMAISAHFDIAMGGGKRITLRSLRDVLPSRYFDGADLAGESLPTRGESSNPSISALQLIHASDAALDSWRKENLLEAINILSKEVKRKDQRHHALATRAFLRARLRQYDFAIKDARKSIVIQPTILAHVALSMACFGRGNVKSAKKAFNQLFLKCDIDDICFVTLIKAVVMFTFGYHSEAIARVADLIVVCPERDTVSYSTIQAHMRLIAAKACVSRQEYDSALELLANLQHPLFFPQLAQLKCISLMFGWTLDSDAFKFTLCRQQCEALYALGRQKEAEELLGTVLNDLERQSESRSEVKEWLRDFRRRL